MLPPESRLEVRSRLPRASSTRSRRFSSSTAATATRGAGSPISCPGSPRSGFPSHALSLRGHGESGGRESLFVAGLDDYVADVEHVAATLPSPPVLIGHSMGAAVVERLLTTRPDSRRRADGAGSARRNRPGGASRLMAWQPEYLVNMQRLDAPHLSGDVMAALRPMYFSDTTIRAIMLEATAHFTIGIAARPARPDGAPARTASPSAPRAARSSWARMRTGSPPPTTSTRPRRCMALRRLSCRGSRT